LEGCLFSVLAQAKELQPLGITVHHHVQDGQSGSTVLNRLRMHQKYVEHEGLTNFTFTYCSEPDRSMYNALNLAYGNTEGILIGHLNSDEQYQPNALLYAYQYLYDHPKTDVLCGATIVTKDDGEYICSRLPVKPTLWHTRMRYLTVFTASMFYRRSAINQLSTYFSEKYRIIGDADLVYRMIKQGLNFHTTNAYYSLFIDSGSNLALSPDVKSEKRTLFPYPVWVATALKPFVACMHWCKKFANGSYTREPFTYIFYDSDNEIIERSVQKPANRWARTPPPTTI
jgi:hypothetical protein